MFFGNFKVLLFVKFLWAGLILGLASIVLKTVAKIFRKNVVIVNLFEFVFVMIMTTLYVFMCVQFNDYGLSWVGLLGMLSGVVIIKISIDFFFDYFLRFIYNEFIIRRGCKENGKRKIQADKKV